MIPLEQLLTRFKSLTNTEKVKKELACDGIKKIIGITIPVSTISVSKNTIFLKVPPIIKTEVLLKKQEILADINTINGLAHISDIK
ncbi:MAG: hypothetical protein A2481_03745 [Candidatus Yonathbacteria bacterium RIFOXYC2_FULL_47_9]|nr:MAG: hypothetical protein A2481_03745 [Candidatus Yonathbacteria bacterium RIFOXYC2_FULL_47_9]HAT68262.1 hypothetical protein [Candidatus Yonathbacteria bacterium]